MQLETVKVVDRLTRTSPLGNFFSTFDFDPSDPKSSFHKLLDIIEQLLLRAISEGKPPEIVVLSPFLYEHYVKRFIEFVEGLRKKIPKLKVMVITRKPAHVSMNRKEHVRLVEKLRKANIVVKMKALRTRDGKEKPFHGKVVIVGTEYVIAGSINPLAPSYFETPIVTTLLMLVRNPGTWRALRRLLVEDEGDERKENKDVMKASPITIAEIPPKKRVQVDRYLVFPAIRKNYNIRERPNENKKRVLLYA